MALRQLELQEWGRVEAELTFDEVVALRALPAGLTIQPLASNRWTLESSSLIGAATTPTLRVLITPKLEIDRVYYLLGYSRGVTFSRDLVELATELDLVEGFIASFVSSVEQTLRRGVLAGYRSFEETSIVLKGRLRVADQIRHHFDLPLPVEISYDDFTPDIDANRIIKAGLRRAAQLRLRTPQLRRRIVRALTQLETVADVRYHPKALPELPASRLLDRYRPAFALASLVIQSTAIELRGGVTSSAGFFIDMNQVFEDFVFNALGDRLKRLLPPAFRWRQGKSVYIDENRQIRAKPDLSLWDGPRCVFVGDAKYKRTDVGHASDIYQLLAYCTSTQLPTGTLIYADAPERSHHRVRHTSITLRVEPLTVDAPMHQLDQQCDGLATEISHSALHNELVA